MTIDIAWTRIELDAIDETLTQGLQAELHDPLWLLARQWQLGECRGEDVGTPVLLRGETAADALQALFVGDGVHGADDDACIEAHIEREAAAEPDLLLRLLGARSLVEGLVAAGLAAAADRCRADFAWHPDGDDDDDGVVLAAGARLPDAEAVWGIAAAAPLDLARALGVGAAQTPTFVDAVTRWSAWYGARRGAGGGQGWSDADWTHQGTVRTRAGVELKAADHGGGAIDWRAFDTRVGADATPAPDRIFECVPLPMQIPGTGSLRFWQMEDAQVDLGALAAGTTEVARMLLAEFALLWGHDWFTAPVALRAGTLASVQRLQVIDTFGVVTPVAPARNDGGYALWRHGGSSGAAAGLWVGETVAIAGAGPIERLDLIVDEGANMLWAHASRDVDAIGLPLPPAVPAPAAAPAPAPADGRWHYRPFTTPPAGWVPLVVVDGRVQVAELALGDLPVTPLHTPLAATLALRADHLRTEGLSLWRQWEVARRGDGTLVAWIARRRQTEPPIAVASLVFDRIET